MKNAGIFIIGFLVHLVLLYSIFDIYFTSPLVHGMAHFKPGTLFDNVSGQEDNSQRLQPPAKRLVLFVADGLRADKAFELNEKGQPRAPFLRKMIENEGTWAFSHTRVPTESRPGHVALVAGFYEDVSAVAKGWKENPVDFDSVFNQSRYTWSWGSPDILPMFAKGASGDHVYAFMYPAENEDFAGADSTQLDSWVFDKVTDFLEDGRRNEMLKEKLHQDEVVLFLHLLGIDVNGHSYRPRSSEYLRNIRIVDEGVEAVVSAVEDYYGYDGKTAYVFTSDHGMTDWGSHGAGHLDETRTPLVIWGAGAGRPQRKVTESVDETSAWKLGQYIRHDVEQGDVAALMTSLLGLSFPANSVGVTPVDMLSVDERYKAECMLANLLAILAQYEVKMDQKRSTSFAFLFKPFPDGSHLNDVTIRRTYAALVENGRYQDAISYCRDTMRTTLSGLTYYHQYDRLFLGISVTLGFVGWMAYVLILILNDRSAAKRHRPMSELERSSLHLLFALFGIALTMYLFAQSVTWTYYVYCLTPLYIWYLVLKTRSGLVSLITWSYKTGLWKRYSLVGVKLWIGLEIMVLSFFYRGAVSFGLIALALYPFLTPLVNTHLELVLKWTVSCGMLAVFPMLPVIGRGTSYGFVSGSSSHRRLTADDSVIYIQLSALGVVLYTVYNTWSCLSGKQPIGTVWHMFSWAILGSSVLLPLFSATRIASRLYSIALSFLTLYYLLCVAHEGIFCLILCITLRYWVELELQLSHHGSSEIDNFVGRREIFSDHSELNLTNLRHAYTFMFFIMTSFFGTGNIASLNSFEPSSVYCFVTVFNPFVMGTLIVVKVLIPFLLVTCAFQAILCVSREQTRGILLLVLFMSDFMGLHFFFLVRDEGSWLDIGTTISHYTIVMTMILALMVLMAAARWLTTVSLTTKTISTDRRNVRCYKRL